jgi:hypothetical protein
MSDALTVIAAPATWNAPENRERLSALDRATGEAAHAESRAQRIQAERELRQWQDAVVAAFAASRGWKPTKRSRYFARTQLPACATNYTYLRPDNLPWDHPYAFCSIASPYLVQGIVVHSWLNPLHHDLRHVDSIAALVGLAVERLPWSWYKPTDRCTALLYTPLSALRESA